MENTGLEGTWMSSWLPKTKPNIFKFRLHPYAKVRVRLNQGILLCNTNQTFLLHHQAASQIQNRVLDQATGCHKYNIETCPVKNFVGGGNNVCPSNVQYLVCHS